MKTHYEAVNLRLDVIHSFIATGRVLAASAVSPATWVV